MTERPSWWSLRFPWEREPPFWRPFKRTQWREIHERIRALEHALLDIDMPKFPWEYYGW